MAVRTVRLDAESERVLGEVRRVTGLSTSGVLKRGIVAVRDAIRETAGRDPWGIYVEIDLGMGGAAHGRGRRAKQAIRRRLRERKA
jgi:hypothetical protein